MLSLFLFYVVYKSNKGYLNPQTLVFQKHSRLDVIYAYLLSEIVLVGISLFLTTRVEIDGARK